MFSSVHDAVWGQPGIQTEICTAVAVATIKVQ